MAAKRTGSAGANPAGRWARLRRYFEDAYLELQRVTWPSRQFVMRGTIVVIAVLVFLSFYVFILDSILSALTASMRR